MLDFQIEEKERCGKEKNGEIALKPILNYMKPIEEFERRDNEKPLQKKGKATKALFDFFN